MLNKKYIDNLGTDFTEYITTPEKELLFNKMCELELKCKRPIKECYREIVEVLNLEAEIKGKPKRAFIQGNPKDN